MKNRFPVFKVLHKNKRRTALSGAVLVGGARMIVMDHPPFGLGCSGDGRGLGELQAEATEDGLEVRDRLVAGGPGMRPCDLDACVLGEVADRHDLVVDTEERQFLARMRAQVAELECLEDFGDRRITLDREQLLLREALGARSAEASPQLVLRHIPGAFRIVVVDDPEDLMVIAVARGGVGHPGLLDDLLAEH